MAMAEDGPIEETSHEIMDDGLKAAETETTAVGSATGTTAGGPVVVVLMAMRRWHISQYSRG